MKAIEIKSARPFQSRNDKSYNIQTYGENNDFPQLVSRIVGASCTGKSCLKVYGDFVRGQGFVDRDLQRLTINRRGEKLGEILRLAADDLTKFGGFALHVNYNGFGQIVELSHMPFEHLRFEKVDTETGLFSKVAEHDDWAREFEGVKRFRKQDIVFYDLYDPRPEVVEAQALEAGGWDSYLGQVFYYSSDGRLVYPVPIFEPELTDMRSEEAVSNVIGRNAANNMFTAGALVTINDKAESEEEAKATYEMLRNYQGDHNTGNIALLEVASKEDVPVWMPFTGTNYDKALSQTQTVLPDNIGRVFNQPPILRAQDVGANFGADLMVNAYDYYNSKTSGERQTLSEVFGKIFEHWHEPHPNDFTIQPLAYVFGRSIYARLGGEVMDKVIEIIKDATLDDVRKRILLGLGYGLSEKEIDELMKTKETL